MTNKTQTIKDLLESNLSEANRKAAILLAVCTELGVDYTLIRSAKTGTAMVHIRLEDSLSSKNINIPALAEIVDVPSSSNSDEEAEEEEEHKTSSAPIEVPRDFLNGAKAKHKAAVENRSSVIYYRFRTPSFTQAIDRKWSFADVMKLATLRRKEGSNLPERKHLVKVMSDLLGVSDFTTEKPSYKEILCMLSIAKGKCLTEKVKDIFNNFKIGNVKFYSTYLKYMSIDKYIGKSEAGLKFLAGEKIDLNQSLRFFIDAEKVTEEPSE